MDGTKIGWDDLDSGDEVLRSDSSTSSGSSSLSSNAEGSSRRGKPLEDPDKCGSAKYCHLEELVQVSRSTFPQANVLLVAHLALDSLAAVKEGGRWTDVYVGIKTFCKPRVQHSAGATSPPGDGKAFKRLNGNSVLHHIYEQTWDASAHRLRQRVSHLLTTLRESDSLRSYIDALSNADRKAYNACAQIWRKSLRNDTMTVENADADHHLLTAIEASILCRQDTEPTLLICLLKGRNNGDRHGMTDWIDSIPASAWNKAKICADQSDYIASIVVRLLGNHAKLAHLAISQHGRRAEESLGRRTTTLTPSILESETLKDIDNTFVEISDEDTLSESDLRQAVAVINKTNGSGTLLFAQAPKLASLATLSSMVLRRNKVDVVGTLPPHLEQGIKTAGKCTSCGRCMMKQRIKPRDTMSSVQFKKEAKQAGFKVRRSVTSEVIASLSAGDAYLPPLKETFELRKDKCRWGSQVTIGSLDPSSLQQWGDLEDHHSWHFCAACAASHLHIGSSLGMGTCQCFGCRSERSALADPEHILKWRRHRFSNKEEYARIMQAAGLTFG